MSVLLKTSRNFSMNGRPAQIYSCNNEFDFMKFCFAQLQTFLKQLLYFTTVR